MYIIIYLTLEHIDQCVVDKAFVINYCFTSEVKQYTATHNGSLHTQIYDTIVHNFEVDFPHYMDELRTQRSLAAIQSRVSVANRPELPTIEMLGNFNFPGDYAYLRPPHIDQFFFQVSFGAYDPALDPQRLAEGRNNCGFMMFGNQNMMVRMWGKQTISTDGTFKVVPAPFYQLTTINFFETNAAHVRRMFCGVFVLMTHKTRFLYDRVLNYLRDWATQRGLDANPAWRRAIMDDESAMVSAIRAFSGNTQPTLCFFHFGQTVNRNVASKGLMRVFKDKESLFHNLVQKIKALAFLPVHSVLNSFNEIIAGEDLQQARVSLLDWQDDPQAQPINLTEGFDEFIQWFRNNYLTEQRIPFWNVSSWQDLRTNNDVEGFHHTLSLKMGPIERTFWPFVTKLREMQEVSDRLYRQMHQGAVMRHRSRNYQELENRIAEAKQHYAEDHDTIRFLSRISYLIGTGLN